ncbi:hypothetical protein C8R46DRAFT_1175615 [Mycena filopes]|nr:hypothetical protein C8R46DRAFT_1175615 [Mycena filopes]
MSAPPPAISADLWESLIPIDADETESTEAPTVTVVPTPSATTTIPAAPAQSAYGHYQTQNYANYAPAPQGAYEVYRQYNLNQAQQAHAQAQQAQQNQFSAGASAYGGGASSSHSSAPQQSMARQAIANSHGQSSQGPLDTADVATLNDALGSAGVDLRAEEESLQRANDTPAPYRPYEADRAHKQPARPHFDASFLGARMRAIAAQHKVLPPAPPSAPSAPPSAPAGSQPQGSLPDDTITYLALALRARLQDLVTGMIAAARHRAKMQAHAAPGLYADGRAAWGVRVRGDVGRVLSVLERVERAEERREREEREERERRTGTGTGGKERERAVEEALGAFLEGRVDEFLEARIPEVDGNANPNVDAPSTGPEAMDLDHEPERPPQRKKAKRTPLTEEERAEAANRAAGNGPRRYAWLTTNLKSATKLGKPPPPPPPGGGGVNPYAALTSAFARQAMDSVNALPAREQESEDVRALVYPMALQEERGVADGEGAMDADLRMRVTLRDAMFVIEKERGHGGGRGAARGWS